MNHIIKVRDLKNRSIWLTVASCHEFAASKMLRMKISFTGSCYQRKPLYHVLHNNEIILETPTLNIAIESYNELNI